MNSAVVNWELGTAALVAAQTLLTNHQYCLLTPKGHQEPGRQCVYWTTISSSEVHLVRAVTSWPKQQAQLFRFGGSGLLVHLVPCDMSPTHSTPGKTYPTIHAVTCSTTSNGASVSHLRARPSYGHSRRKLFGFERRCLQCCGYP